MSAHHETTADHPFRVSSGGPPSMFVGFTMTGAMLRGGLTAHHGLIIGVPCRIVEDPDSPLTFKGIGEVSYTKQDVKGLDVTERWVALEASMDVLRANVALLGKQVRIEYPATVVAK